MNRKTIVVAAAAGALVVSAGTAWALGTSGNPAATGVAATSTVLTSEDSPTSSSSSGTTTARGLSADDAARMVREHLGGGTVRTVEREVEHGRVEWKVEITKAGVTYDIRVDALSGAVTRVDADDRSGSSGRDGTDERTGEDQAGDDRGDDHGGHGADDAAGDNHGDNHGDDHGDDHGGHGADDAAGDDHGGDR